MPATAPTADAPQGEGLTSEWWRKNNYGKKRRTKPKKESQQSKWKTTNGMEELK